MLINKVKNLPNTFGVYCFLKNKEFLYIGKSKNLKNRVSSYFKSTLKRHVFLVNNSDNISYFIVDSEKDALFLENNLIKKYKPKYNILLKDDKSFPWLCIKNERFPRFFITRNNNNSDFYFGPYVSKKHLNNLFFLIKKLYNIRTCNYNLSEKNIVSKKYKVCLDYHLKNCKGPCVGYQSEKDYNYNIYLIKKLLSGNYSIVLKKLEKKLLYNSKKLLFENCEIIKNQINSIKLLKSKSIIVCEKKLNIDCFYVFSIKNKSYLNFIRVVEGSLVYLKNYIVYNNGWSDSFVLESFLKKTFINYKKLSNNIISNIDNSYFLNKKIIVPKIGYKKKILNFSFNILNNYIKSKKIDVSVLFDLKNQFNLKKTPFIIHCFDISTLNGYNTTGSCVVFKNSKPLKSLYKSFLIKNKNNIDDYKCISNVLIRKYKKHKNIPDLIIIDGGKGHLKTAISTLLKINISNIDIISIAKKEELIYLKNNICIKLNKKNSSLNLVKFIRDEAHRFCLKKHRLNRKNNFIKSELNNINGIGIKSITKLILKFKSINNIKKSSLKDIISCLGYFKGKIVYNYFNK